jgi:hypothetical protein
MADAAATVVAEARAVLKQLDTAMTAFAGKPAPEKKKELEKEVQLNFVRLRTLHRRLTTTIHAAREKEVAARQKSDTRFAEADDIRFQEQRLRDLIGTCTQYKQPTLTSLQKDLVTVADFKKATGEAEGDGFELKRLAYELSERQRLEAERESQEAERAESDKKVASLRERAKADAKKFQTLKNQLAAANLGEPLDTNGESKVPEESLPPPLAMLYSRFAALPRHGVDKSVTVNVDNSTNGTKRRKVEGGGHGGAVCVEIDADANLPKDVDSVFPIRLRFSYLPRIDAIGVMVASSKGSLDTSTWRLAVPAGEDCSRPEPAGMPIPRWAQSLAGLTRPDAQVSPVGVIEVARLEGLMLAWTQYASEALRRSAALPVDGVPVGKCDTLAQLHKVEVADHQVTLTVTHPSEARLKATVELSKATPLWAIEFEVEPKGQSRLTCDLAALPQNVKRKLRDNKTSTAPWSSTGGRLDLNLLALARSLNGESAKTAAEAQTLFCRQVVSLLQGVDLYLSGLAAQRFVPGRLRLVV